MKKYLKEAVLWVLIAIPFIYLVTIWGNLPDRVPTHFNTEGDADGWSTKTGLIFITGIPGIIIYLLMLLIPVIDPKKQLQQISNNYYKLRFMLLLFFSFLMTFCLYSSNAGTMKNPNILLTILGLMFVGIGYCFPNLKSNYFVGLRTPWTLESEQVWIKTHRMASPVWVIGGILIAFLSFILANHHVMIILFFGLLFLMVIIPVVFSYTEFRNEKSKLNQK